MPEGKRRGLSRLANAAGLAALVLGGTIAAVLVAEIGLRLAGFGTLYEIYSKPTLFWRADPLLGWSHEPSSSGIYVGPRPFPIEFEASVRINSLGLRGPELPLRATDEFRILVLGDSAVAGFEVSWERHYIALLERQLELRLGIPVTIINAGVRGYGTDQSYLYYRERGHALDPDLVLFVHNTNDLENNVVLHRMRRIYGKPAFALREDGALELVGHPIPDYEVCSSWRLDARYQPIRTDGVTSRTLCGAQIALADRSALFSLASMVLGRFPELVHALTDLTRSGPRAALGFAAVARAAEPADRSQGAALTVALMGAMDRTVRANGSRLVVIISARDLAELDAQALRRAGVDIQLVERRGATTGLVQSREQLVFERDPHLNERGHYYSALGLVPILVKYHEPRGS